MTLNYMLASSWSTKATKHVTSPALQTCGHVKAHDEIHTVFLTVIFDQLSMVQLICVPYYKEQART